MEAEKNIREIIKTIEYISGTYSPYQVFYDWVHIMALGIQNNISMIHDKLWQEREKEYMELMKKYGEKERKEIVKMFSLLVMAMEYRLSDYLGEVYMKSGCGNKNTGQFFTPYHLSKATANAGIQKEINGTLKINEPSTGGGGMIIAAADILKERGVNYQRKMKVVAQDLDWLAVYMSYVQFSIIGIDAIVVQGNTLIEPYAEGYDRKRTFRTPVNMGVII